MEQQAVLQLGLERIFMHLELFFAKISYIYVHCCKDTPYYHAARKPEMTVDEQSE